MSTWAPESVAMLPDGIEGLARSARNEGFRFMDRLINEYRSGSNTFSNPGEVLLALRLFTDDSDAARLHRFYGYAAVLSDAEASHQKILTDQP